MQVLPDKLEFLFYKKKKIKIFQLQLVIPKNH